MDRRIIVIVVIATLLGFGAYYYSTITSKPRVDIVFKETLGEDPSTLDPHEGFSSSLGNLYRLFYNKLVRYERKNMSTTIVPELALSWERSADAKTWTFTLRQGVKFHDGTPFNASCVKFSIERVSRLNFGPAWYYAIVDRVDVVDTYTARFILNTPYVPFLQVVATYWGNWIVSPSAVAKHATVNDTWAHKWFLENECGTGPYKLERWTRRQELVATKFSEYWEGWSGNHVDKVMFLIGIVEPSTRRLMLEKGDVDLVGEAGFSASDKISLSKVQGVSLYKLPSLNNLHIFFNVQHLPFSNVDVRRAISYAFDYKQIVDNIMAGSAYQAQGPVPKSTIGHNPNLLVYNKNQTKAAQLLDKAGYTVGKAGQGLRMEVDLTYWSGNEDQRKISEFIQSELANIGVKVNIKSALYGAIMDSVHGPADKAPDMVFLYWYPDWNDPDSWLIGQYKSGEFWNMGQYNDSRVDRLVLDAQKEADPTRRIQIHQEIQRILVDEAWALYLYDLENWICMRSWVKNYYYNPIYHDSRDYWYIYVEK